MLDHIPRSCLAAILCLVSPFAVAANGYFLNGWGTNSRSMAGAGVALADSAMVAASNPAGIAALRSRQWQIGGTLLHARPSYRAGEFAEGGPSDEAAFPLKPGPYKGDPDQATQISEVFPIPHMAFSWPVGDSSALALALYGNGGLNATFRSFPNEFCPDSTPKAGTYCFGKTSSDFSQLYLAPTYAWQLSPRIRLGGSLLLAWQGLEIRGLQIFAGRSRDPTRLSNNGHDDSYGIAVKLGAQIRLSSTLRLGITGQTRGYMTRFKDYAGLIADRGDMDMPPYLQVGVAFEPAPRWTVAMDVQRIWYGAIDSLSNDTDAAAPLGSKNGPGFGWEDINSYKLGVRYRLNPDCTLRAGYADGEQPVPSDQLLFNLITGSVTDRHFSAGVSRSLNRRDTIDLGLMWAPDNKVSGENPAAPGQTIESSLGLITVDVSWQRRF